MTKKSTWQKNLKYKIAPPILQAYFSGLRRTSRITVHGEEYIEPLLANKQPFIPCYWHQQNLGCALYLLSLQAKGLNTGFLVSPSRDGEIPAKIFAAWGATVIRGSSSKTGALAMRNLYSAIKRDRVSPANTPDGPRGPIFEFKPGPLMMAQMTGVPIVPMSCAARRSRQLNSWDKFMLPGWFNHITVMVGKPVQVEKGLSLTELEPLRLQLQNELIAMSAICKDKK